MFGAKHIQEESSQTAKDAQETEGCDHSQQEDGLWIHAVIWGSHTSQSVTHAHSFHRVLMRLCRLLTIQKLWVNETQNIRHSQLFSRAGAPMNPEPGRFRQGCAQRGNRQSSWQRGHQASLRLFGQGGAPSPPPSPRDSRTRRCVHVNPISSPLVAALGFLSC